MFICIAHDIPGKVRWRYGMARPHLRTSLSSKNPGLKVSVLKQSLLIKTRIRIMFH